MSSTTAAAIEYLHAQRSQILDRLRALLRIPSISAQPTFAGDCRRAAEFLVDYMSSIGFRSEVAETAGHPAAIGFTAGPPDAPRVLIYGHYDVQPPDPLDLWSVDPFSAELRDSDAAGRPAPEGGVLIARGSSDNKGQLIAMLSGVEAILKSAQGGTAPLNLAVIIEGEEEIGSANLADFVRSRADEFAADIVLLADGELDSTGQPTIVTSARGLVYCTVTVRGPRRDLHSGTFGGVVANPANGLARLIAGLHDSAGRVTLDDFYDGVDELDEAGRLTLARVPGGEQDIAREVGVDVLAGGEVGRMFNERRWHRPTCDINGFGAGYQGPGSKTIIPSHAQAKVSFRLVGRQNPERIAESFQRYLRANCPPGLAVELEFEQGCRPYQADASTPPFAVMADAIRQATGRPPTCVGAGGTLPILAEFKAILNADSVFLGLAREDCQMHSPDEQMNVRDVYRGGEIAATFLANLARFPV